MCPVAFESWVWWWPSLPWSGSTTLHFAGYLAWESLLPFPDPDTYPILALGCPSTLGCSLWAGEVPS